LLYFGSESDKDGSMTITLYFEQGTNPDIAQVQVQNKLQLATPLLPVEVQAQGIRVAKATRNFLLVIGFYSADGSMNNDDISDYVASHVQDPISRTPGVGDYQLFGSQYAMRIWLDSARLDNYGLTPVDVNNALQAQNVQVASGELGGLPSAKGQRLNATIVGPQRLQTAEQFGQKHSGCPAPPACLGPAPGVSTRFGSSRLPSVCPCPMMLIRATYPHASLAHKWKPVFLRPRQLRSP